MLAARTIWVWARLVLLGVASALTLSAFSSLGWPFYSSSGDGSASAYPWTSGLIFSVLTAIVFLLCLDDPGQRRAAFAAFGLTALLSGPGHVVNMVLLARFAPSWAPWTPPHLPLALGLSCAGSSLTLLIWWLRRKPGSQAVLLFTSLLLVLLVVPWITNFCGVESMRIPAAMPASADAHRQSPDALTHFMVRIEAGSEMDIVGFLVQWMGLALSFLVLGYVVVVVLLTHRQRRTASAHSPFPSAADRAVLLVLCLGFCAFILSLYGFENLEQSLSGAELTMGRPSYPYRAGLLAVEFMPAIIFVLASWQILNRIRTASRLRFGFTWIVVLCSFFASFDDYLDVNVLGVLALLISLAQVVLLLRADRRHLWVPSTFAAPGETAAKFALEGSVLFALLASAIMAVAIQLASLSVFAIKYFIMWGTAVKPLHGVAPLDQMVPTAAPGFAWVAMVAGPVYFVFCLLIGVVATLIFSIAFVIGKIGWKLVRAAFRRARKSKSLANEIGPDLRRAVRA